MKASSELSIKVTGAITLGTLKVFQRIRNFDSRNGNHNDRNLKNKNEHRNRIIVTIITTTTLIATIATIATIASIPEMDIVKEIIATIESK